MIRSPSTQERSSLPVYLRTRRVSTDRSGSEANDARPRISKLRVGSAGSTIETARRGSLRRLRIFCRADAERNRERILAAAREVFAERGLDAPFDVIAHRAGVGQATLYRRFPRREDLIVACFAPKLAEYAAAVEEALAAPDAWTGLCAYVEHI